MSTCPTIKVPSGHPTHLGKLTGPERRQYLQFVDDGMENYDDPVPEHLKASTTNRYSKWATKKVKKDFVDYLNGKCKDGERRWPLYSQVCDDASIKFGASDMFLAWNQISQDLEDADCNFNIFGRGDVCDTMTQHSGQLEELEEQPDEGESSHDQTSEVTVQGTKASQSTKSKLHAALKSLRGFGRNSST